MLSNISYKDHITNEKVRRKIQSVKGQFNELLTLDEIRELKWFEHDSGSFVLPKSR